MRELFYFSFSDWFLIKTFPLLQPRPVAIIKDRLTEREELRSYSFICDHTCSCKTLVMYCMNLKASPASFEAFFCCFIVEESLDLMALIKLVKLHPIQKQQSRTDPHVT